MTEGDCRQRQSGDRRSGWYSRGYLPHRDEKGLIQHVTVHLADSLPKSAIEEIEQTLENWPDDERAAERRRRLHEWVDAGHGSCVLRHGEAAEMVQEALHHFDGVRYHLHAWVVMPNHVHVLFEPVNNWALNKIVASWKKFTARRIREFVKEGGNANRRANLPIGKWKTNADQEIGVPGPVWHREFWDRYIRNEAHYRQAVEYIHNNPVAAGLVTCAAHWPWTSAGEP
jgi:REP-associated tyrosine transposase